MKPILRNGTWYLRRRVPLAFKNIEARSTVWISLRTGSKVEARRRAESAWASQVAIWEAKLDGRDGDALTRFEAARRLAQASGLRYLDSERVAKLPWPDLEVRLRAWMAPEGGGMDKDMATALLITAEN